MMTPGDIRGVKYYSLMLVESQQFSPGATRRPYSRRYIYRNQKICIGGTEKIRYKESSGILIPALIQIIPA
jgi:hypothetical protein